MKKLLIVLTLVLSFLCINAKAYTIPEKTDHEKVTIYIFRGSECPHCYDALKFFYNNQDAYKEFVTVKAIEVWENEDNKKLMDDVKEYFKSDADGVPFIVAGEGYAEAGYADGMEDTILEAAFREYEKEDYHDVVKELASKNKKVKIQSLKEAWYEENGIDADGKTHNHDTLIVIGIFVVIIGGLSALIFFGRKNN